MTEQEFEQAAKAGGWALQSGGWERCGIRLEILVDHEGWVEEALMFGLLKTDIFPVPRANLAEVLA